jgi:hypothetical protein
MEEQPEMSSAVTAPLKLDGLRINAIRSQNKRTIYEYTSEQSEHFQ